MTLITFTISLHCSRSCDFPLKLLTPTPFKSSSTESSYLTAGLILLLLLLFLVG
jgi:hypothetical protein